MNKFIFLFALLIIIPFTSGLEITEISLEVNKTYQQDSEFTIEVYNPSTFEFREITFEESFIDLPKFSLVAGEIKNITGIITRDNDFNGEIILEGEYETQLGASNITEIVNFEYGIGFDICDLNLIKGDSVVWNNQYSDKIKLINSDTGIEFTEIEANSNYTQKFNSPEELNYHATWLGIEVTDYCQINVINDFGWVHNPIYDAKISLNLDIVYQETELDVSFFGTSYTIEYNGEISDTLRIEIIGTREGKNIHLEGEWMNFSQNDFDLSVGQSINIDYTIKPEIFETNDTGKDYIKKLIISGNFETIEQEINISIPYEEVELFGSSEVDEELIQNFFKYWCEDNPIMCEELFCAINPDECVDGKRVGGGSISQVFSGNTISGLLEGYGNLLEKYANDEKTRNEIAQNQTNQLANLSRTFGDFKKDSEEDKQRSENIATAMMFVIFIVLVLIILYIGFVVLKNDDVRSKAKRILKFSKGER